MKDEPVFEYHPEEKNIEIITPEGSIKPIKINPGWSFGTGDHETTKLCIKALESLFSNAKMDTVLDIGCGSGVLSICSAILGAEKVIGLDLEPKIIDEAKINARRNGILEKTHFSTQKLEELEIKFDLIVANILIETINSLKAAILQKLKPQGTLIISGIRNNQKDLAVNTFKEDGLDLILELNTNEWNALVLRDRETSSHT